MSYKEAIQELDTLMPLAEFAVANLRVVQTALNEKIVSAAEGGDALFTVCEYLRDLHDQMTMIVNRAIKEGREQSPLMEVGA